MSHRQSKSDWWMPGEAMGLWFVVLLPLGIALLTFILFPVAELLRNVELNVLYASAVISGCLGVLLLLIARWPLYRIGKFLSFGPRLLDKRHRRFYWVAYVFLTVSVLLFLSIAARP